jgi:hypothetical protein
MLLPHRSLARCARCRYLLEARPQPQRPVEILECSHDAESPTKSNGVLTSQPKRNRGLSVVMMAVEMYKANILEI